MWLEIEYLSFLAGPKVSDVSIRESVTFSGDRPPCITLEIQVKISIV